MTPSPRTRRIAAILAVAFLLTAVWAAFYLYSESHPAGGGPSTPILATFSQQTLGNFTASLSPSYLYDNVTQIEGGNVTLFTSITNWINATIVYSFTANRSVDVSLIDTFQVVLSTSVWSKTLFTTINTSSYAATTAFSLSFDYAANVSSVVALASAIDTQLGYTGASYSLALVPSVVGTVSVPGASASLDSVPALNFSFSGALISPAGLSHSASGSVIGAAPPSSSSLGNAVFPIAALAGSLGAFGGSTWVATRRPEEEPLPPLDELVRPYDEAIALVAEAPAGAVTTPVRTFPDLIKIADILGKPVLRPSRPDPARSTFYVIDGRFGYVYRYPGPTGETLPSPEGASLPEGELAPEPEATQLAERLRNDLLRLEALRADDATSETVRHEARRAIQALSSGNSVAARTEIEQIELQLSKLRRRNRSR